MAPKIQFCQNEKKQNIAYSVDGSGPPLVCPAWWVSHVERDWEDANFRAFFEGLAKHRTVIRYDRIGVGLSQRKRDTFTLEDEYADLATVIKHLSLECVTLFSISCAGPVAITYATRHPEKVQQLIFYGSFSQGQKLGPSEVWNALTALIRAHWGLGSKTIANLFSPEYDKEELRQLCSIHKEAASPKIAAQLMELTYNMDVEELLQSLDIPSLVLHRRKDKTIPYQSGLWLASQIPNATFKSFDGTSHVPWKGDFQALLEAIFDFLGHSSPPSAKTIEAGSAPTHAMALRKKGELWELQFGQEQAMFKKSKGLQDLSMLLAHPHKEIHALELQTGSSYQATLSHDPVLDEQAQQSYQQRLLTIEQALEQAIQWNDPSRKERLRQEKEILLSELQKSTGLGGRRRQHSHPEEKARKAVSSRIKGALTKIRKQLPTLGNHLEQSVKTGLFCAYEPQDTIHWQILDENPSPK